MSLNRRIIRAVGIIENCAGAVGDVEELHHRDGVARYVLLDRTELECAAMSAVDVHLAEDGGEGRVVELARNRHETEWQVKIDARVGSDSLVSDNADHVLNLGRHVDEP